MALSVENGTQTMIPLARPKKKGDAPDCVSMSNDHYLVLAARAGCPSAFSELWDLYSRRVYGTILCITKNPQDAEDALQESFFHAHLALENFEGQASFYTWLTRIAINAALGILRKRRRRPESSLNVTAQWEEDGAALELRDMTPNPEQVFEEKQRRTMLLQAIDKLPPNLRVAVQTRIAADCSVKEIAYRLGISQAAAKSRLYRASSRLETTISTNYRPRAIAYSQRFL